MFHYVHTPFCQEYIHIVPSLIAPALFIADKFCNRLFLIVNVPANNVLCLCLVMFYYCLDQELMLFKELLVHFVILQIFYPVTGTSAPADYSESGSVSDYLSPY